MFSENQRDFFDSIGLQRGYRTLNDFHAASNEIIWNSGGKALLEKTFSGSIVTALQTVYPLHKWSVLMPRNRAPSRHWESNKHQREFLERLGRKLNFKQMEDWYCINYQELIENSGGGLLSKYGSSPSKLITSTFTEHEWEIHRFNTVPKKYWENLQGQREFMDWLGKGLGLKKMHHWYKITGQIFQQMGGGRLLAKYGSLSNLIPQIYPDHKWEDYRFYSKR